MGTVSLEARCQDYEENMSLRRLPPATRQAEAPASVITVLETRARGQWSTADAQLSALSQRDQIIKKRRWLYWASLASGAVVVLYSQQESGLEFIIDATLSATMMLAGTLGLYSGNITLARNDAARRRIAVEHDGWGGSTDRSFRG